MGKAPGHDVDAELQAVETEVDQLRRRTQELITELERRVQERVANAKHTFARVRHAVDVKAQVREHPRAAAGIGGGSLIAVGLGTWFVLHRLREQRRFVPRLERRARALGAFFSDPERHLSKKEPVGRRVLGAVLATAATMLVRALVQRMVEPARGTRRELGPPSFQPTA
jgi:hypothetical protein